jgi:hypothetical protein
MTACDTPDRGFGFRELQFGMDLTALRSHASNYFSALIRIARKKFVTTRCRPRGKPPQLFIRASQYRIDARQHETSIAPSITKCNLGDKE